MANFINAIGFVSGALGIVSFGQDNVAPEVPQGAAIRLKAGNGGQAAPEVEGDISAVYAWDRDDQYLGQADGAHIKLGDIQDLTIDSFSAGIVSEYIGVSVGNDAVCITWITVKNFDSTPGGAWTVDVGWNCGRDWYEQRDRAGYKNATAEVKEDYYPKCTWLDGDRTNDIREASMKFKVTAYSSDGVQQVADAGEGCKWTKFGSDTGPIDGVPRKRSTNNNRERLPWMETKLIISNITAHKAENMCNSATSWGPDFVSPDGMFCDMGTKTLAPLCSVQNVQGCVDIDEEERVVKKRSFVAKRHVDSPHRKYEKVTKW